MGKCGCCDTWCHAAVVYDTAQEYFGHGASCFSLGVQPADQGHSGCHYRCRVELDSQFVLQSVTGDSYTAGERQGPWPYDLSHRMRTFDDLIMLYYVVDFTLFESVFRFSSLQLLVSVLFSWHRRCFLLVSFHVVMLFSGDSFWCLFCFCLFFSPCLLWVRFENLRAWRFGAGNLIQKLFSCR